MLLSEGSRRALARFLPAAAFGLVACATLVACSSDDDTGTAAGAAGAAGSGAAAGAGTGGTGGSAVASRCAEAAAALDTSFDFDPEGPDGQIHAFGVMVSDGAWIVYNRPGEAGAFDVYATKISCAGVPVVAPVRLSQSNDNEIDPTAAWDESAQRLLVVWSADQSGKTPNLELRSRLVSASGEPVGDVHSLALQRKGSPVGGNVWMPQLAKSPSGFGLVGTWGHDDAPGFQAFVQALDADGALIGDGEDVGLDPASSHDAPVIAFAADGTRLLAYSTVTNDSPSAQPYDVWMKIGDAAPALRATAGGHATLAVGASGAWIAAQDAAGKIDAPSLQTNKSLYQPAIAASDTGAALVAYTKAANKSPLRAHRLDAQGALVGAGIDLSVGAAAYPIHLEAVPGSSDGDLFFVAFQEGAGQTIRGKARFFRAP